MLKYKREKFDVLIIGAGPAGASLAINLAKKNLRVLLADKDKFPREKLCGEFVSPECISYLESLGVFDSIKKIGGDTIRETKFFTQKGKSIIVPSKWFFEGEKGAIGISRAEMDFCLMKKARETGAEVLEGGRAVSIKTNSERIESVKIKENSGKTIEIKAEIIVDATGRAQALAKLLDKNGAKKEHKKIKQVAFKTHFSDVDLEKGVCEIYSFHGGYGGLNHIENKTANHCFIVDSEIARNLKGNADRIFRNVVLSNNRAFETLKNAKRQSKWLAVSIKRFGRQPTNRIKNLFSIGDASAFIDPFTGSGILMAFESSAILAGLILHDSSKVDSQSIRQLKYEYEKRHAQAIRRRLWVCKAMRSLAFAPTFAEIFVTAARANDRFLKTLASSTRPEVI